MTFLTQAVVNFFIYWLQLPVDKPMSIAKSFGTSDIANENTDILKKTFIICYSFNARWAVFDGFNRSAE